MPAGSPPRPGPTLVHDHRVLRSHLPDLTPLRENPAYRRLYAVGLGLSFAQQAFGFAKLADPGQFVIDAYPVSVRLFDVSVIAAVAVGLCAVAAIYPASRAARVDPARAVQGV